jgi:hypothetical protein
MDQIGNDQVKVMSTMAKMAAIKISAEEEEGRRIRDSLFVPRVTELNEAINSCRKKIM